MELINNNRRTTAAEIVPYNPKAPHVAEALQQMGDELEFFTIYVPANLHTICDRQENAMRTGKTRQVSLIMAAYGTAPVLRCIKEHLIWLKMLLVIDWSAADIEAIAVGILRTEEARLLDWITLLRFFRDIADGRITLYGGNYGSVMQAFQDYNKRARVRDGEMRTQLAQEREQSHAEVLRGEAVAKMIDELKKTVEK